MPLNINTYTFFFALLLFPLNFRLRFIIVRERIKTNVYATQFSWGEWKTKDDFTSPANHYRCTIHTHSSVYIVFKYCIYIVVYIPSMFS